MHSKWPSDLEAIRNVKLAFYLKIRELLLQAGGIKCNVSQDYLDVYCKGLVFRLRIYHSKELAFMKRVVRPDGVVAYEDNPESVRYELLLNVLPRIVGALNG